MASVVTVAGVTDKCRASLRRNYRELIDGGFPALIRKGKIVLLMLIAMPVLLSVYALSPLILIRFGPLPSRRIGSLAPFTEMYLCQRDVGMDNRNTLDIFFHISPICNQQLKKMWDRKLRVSALAGPLYTANCHLPGGSRHAIQLPNDIDTHGLLPRTKMHLSFTPEEETWGQAGLTEIGIPEGSPFVCLYARDTVYVDAISPVRPDGNQDYRNASIHNCVPLAEELVSRGYFVIRMGALVNEALRTTNPMIIDYATKARTDFMDIFLCAKCSFFIGSTGGINTVPRVFRRPTVFLNAVPLETHIIGAATPGNLIIPKHLWLRQESRFLTFQEIVDSEVSGFFKSEQYEGLGIEVLENTPDEIAAVSLEMDERLRGTWQTTEEDRKLQRRLWSIFNVTEPNEEFRPRVGAEFLRSNPALLK